MYSTISGSATGENGAVDPVAVYCARTVTERAAAIENRRNSRLPILLYVPAAVVPHTVCDPPFSASCV